MFNTQLDTATRTLTIEFPNNGKLRKETFNVTSADHATRLYETNAAKYIVTTLARWVKQREWTLKYLNEMTPAREYAIGALRTMLDNHAESKLHMIILQVAKHDDDILRIAPGEKSRYYRHYLYNIVNIRYWCRNEYQRLYHPDLKHRL